MNIPLVGGLDELGNKIGISCPSVNIWRVTTRPSMSSTSRQDVECATEDQVHSTQWLSTLNPAAGFLRQLIRPNRISLQLHPQFPLKLLMADLHKSVHFIQNEEPL